MKFARALSILAIFILGLFIGAFADNAIAQTSDAWWFTADRPVAIHAGRGLDTPKVQDIATGESVLLTGTYVQADDLIWIPVYGTTNYAAVARYGYCEIRSFGSYDPPEHAPVSGVDTTQR